MLHFQHFKKDISGIQIPDKFTFPFYYEPNLLAKIAAKELQEYLEKQTEFKHEFGIKNSTAKKAIGKMFGVLIVKNTEGTLGYLAAFSGKLDDESLPNKFVPPIFNMRTQGGFYEQGEKKIEKIGEKIQQIKKDKNYLLNKKLLEKHIKYVEEDLSIQRKKMRISKLTRKHQKKEARIKLDDKNFEVFTKKLIQESFNDQFFYRELQEYYEDKIKKIKDNEGK